MRTRLAIVLCVSLLSLVAAPDALRALQRAPVPVAIVTAPGDAEPADEPLGVEQQLRYEVAGGLLGMMVLLLLVASASSARAPVRASRP